MSTAPTSRPRVIVHMGATVDGRITLARGRSSEEEAWQDLLGPDRRPLPRPPWDLFAADAILEGSSSFLPGPARPLPGPVRDVSHLYQDFIPGDLFSQGNVRWHVVVDSRGRLRWSYGTHDGWHLLILASHRTPAGYLADLQRKGIPYLVIGEERVDLRGALGRLLGQPFRLRKILCVGGGRLNGALLRAGLVDEVSILVLPALVGGWGTPTLFDAPELASGEYPTRLRLFHYELLPGDTIWVRYHVESVG